LTYFLLFFLSLLGVTSARPRLIAAAAAAAAVHSHSCLHEQALAGVTKIIYTDQQNMLLKPYMDQITDASDVGGGSSVSAGGGLELAGSRMGSGRWPPSK